LDEKKEEGKEDRREKFVEKLLRLSGFLRTLAGYRLKLGAQRQNQAQNPVAMYHCTQIPPPRGEKKYFDVV
jgi:hypothetical protein